jgi:hypothetical protein
LTGDWTIHVQDSENARETKVRIEFSFEDKDPAKGSGKMTVFEAPHLVK